MTSMQYDLFSVDDHIIEPPNVWMDRLPSKYKDVGPRVLRRPGHTPWSGRCGKFFGFRLGPVAVVC